MFRIALFAILALFAAGRGQAQDTQAPTLAALKGDYFAKSSNATGRTYHIYVRLPADYGEAPDRRYPVVFLLDGDSMFPILAADHLFLTYDDKLPEAVVVGIAYGGFDPAVNKRGIDFMAPGEGVASAAAGAPAFLRFLKDELLPDVEARYRADPARRIIVGQSRSGSFVVWSAFADPDLFWGRIASNPPFDPIGAYDARPAASSRDDLTLVVVSGTDGGTPARPTLPADARAWLQRWEARTGTPWAVRGVTIPGGTHAANLTDAYRAGMRLLFGLPARE